MKSERVVDHVVDNEGGWAAGSNLSRYTVAGITWILRNENR